MDYGQYRRHVIKAQSSFYVNKWCHLFHVQNTDPLTIRGRSTLTDGVVNECIFRNRSFRELKIPKQSNDLAKVFLDLEPIQKSNGSSINEKKTVDGVFRLQAIFKNIYESLRY